MVALKNLTETKKRFTSALTLTLSLFTIVLFPATAAWPLSLTTNTITFTSVTLDGAIQTINGSTSAWRVDATGEAGGWNMTISSTDFDNGATKLITVANLTVRLPEANILAVSGDPNGPSSTQTTYTVVSGSTLKLASAASGDGDGIYDLTPEFQLSVPAEAFTGSYSATVTIAVTAGP